MSNAELEMQEKGYYLDRSTKKLVKIHKEPVKTTIGQVACILAAIGCWNACRDLSENIFGTAWPGGVIGFAIFVTVALYITGALEN